VARAEAIDAIAAPADGRVLRIAPDDAIVTGTATLTVDDPHAIIEPEYTFVSWTLTLQEFAAARNYMEWPQPPAGVLGQGLIAGVPAKIVIGADDVLLVVSASLAHELAERLW
jgi:hypothetical protein